MIFSITFKNLADESVTIASTANTPADVAYDRNVDNAESFELVLRPDVVVLHYTDRTIPNPSVGDVSVAYDKITSLTVGSMTVSKPTYTKAAAAFETAFVKAS